ncbi:MAG: rubredoxin-like domain-containing protein [Deltaproteobacteria bacterium]
MKKKWRCIECGYIHVGPEPPDACPLCYAPREAFAEVEG